MESSHGRALIDLIEKSAELGLPVFTIEKPDLELLKEEFAKIFPQKDFLVGKYRRRGPFFPAK